MACSCRSIQFQTFLLITIIITTSLKREVMDCAAPWPSHFEHRRRPPTRTGRRRTQSPGWPAGGSESAGCGIIIITWIPVTDVAPAACLCRRSCHDIEVQRPHFVEMSPGAVGRRRLAASRWLRAQACRLRALTRAGSCRGGACHVTVRGTT